MTATQTIDKAEQIKVLREYWQDLSGPFNYDTFTAALYKDVADDLTIARDTFDAFLLEVTTGVRCINCGDTIDSIASARLCEGCWHDEDGQEHGSTDSSDDES